MCSIGCCDINQSSVCVRKYFGVEMSTNPKAVLSDIACNTSQARSQLSNLQVTATNLQVPDHVAVDW